MELIVADVSFISLKLLLLPMLRVLQPGGAALLLVKPQFEVGRKGLNSQGVVTDEKLRIGYCYRKSQFAFQCRTVESSSSPVGKISRELHTAATYIP